MAFQAHPGIELSEPAGSLATVVSYVEVEGVYERVLVKPHREPDKVRWFYDVQLKALQEVAADEPLSPPLPESLTPSPGLAARNVGLWQKQPGAGVPGALGLAEGPEVFVAKVQSEVPPGGEEQLMDDAAVRRLNERARIRMCDGPCPAFLDSI